MYIILSIIIGLSMSFLAVMLTYLVSRRKYFQEPFQILEKYKVPAKPKKKGELRRIRKTRALVRKAKRSLMILFLLHLTIFILTYTTAIVLTGMLIPREHQIVQIPLALPLFSARNGTMYITHVLFITFTAYLAPNYLLMRAVRPAKKIEELRTR